MNESDTLADEFFNFDLQEPINRIAYTDEDMKFKCKVIHKMQQLGMKVTIDDIGNICGEIGQQIEKEKNIVIGSHTDSVPNGGQFDGSIGVIAGINVVENLVKENIEIKGNLKIIIYACEESSRYSMAYMGSKYLCEKLDKNKISTIKDKEGIRLMYAVEDARFFIRNNKRKYNLEEIDRVERVIQLEEADYALELHIEQYDSLLEDNIKIGIVDSIVAPLRMNIMIEGKQGHTGATPMDKRQDAVVAGAMLVEKINKYASDETNNLRATIPLFTTENWSANVIPDNAKLFLDIRLQYKTTPEKVIKDIKKIIESIEKSTNTKIRMEILVADEPVRTNEELVDEIKNIAKDSNLKCKTMHSWAGHDLAYVPTKKRALIFIPSSGGSHNKDERTTKQDFNNGVEILEKLVKKLIV